MVRSTWAGKSMKKNKQSRRYVKRRFVKENNTFKDPDLNEEIELNLISNNKTDSKKGSKRGSRKTLNSFDSVLSNESNGHVNIANSNHATNVSTFEIVHQNDKCNDLIKTVNEGTTKKKVYKKVSLQVDDDITNEGPKKLSIKLLAGARKTSRIGLTDETKETDETSQRCEPRIHTFNDSRAGRNVVGLAWVTLTIVFIFMICHSIKWIANFYEMMKV